MNNKLPYVFNIGFGRSGSSSLTAALNILGVPSLHFVLDDNKDVRLEKIILKNKKRNKKLFCTLDQKYQGFSDFGGEKYYQILYEQYPNSKFIFTVRPFELWIKSYIHNEKRNFPERFRTKNSIYDQFFYASNKYFNMGKEIRNFFKDKPDQFLEMRICEGDGWQELCQFLGKDIPDIPFPHLNKA